MLGRAIAALRIERGMKRKDLVASAGISYPYLAEIEKGRKTPSLQKLEKIAISLQVTVPELLIRSEAIKEDPRNKPTT